MDKHSPHQMENPWWKNKQTQNTALFYSKDK